MDLLAWFARNRQSVEADIVQSGRPDWKTRAELLTNAGFRKPNGDPVTPAYCRHLWWKVKRSRPRQMPRPVPITAVAISETGARQFGFAKVKD